jgi:hypothetical protein
VSFRLILALAAGTALAVGLGAAAGYRIGFRDGIAEVMQLSRKHMTSGAANEHPAEEPAPSRA